MPVERRKIKRHHDDEKKYQECDVFGRSCFYGAMANLTQAPENHCKHCMKDCNYVKYNKIIEKAQTIPTSYKLDRRKAEPWQFFTPKTDIDDIKRLLKSRSTPHESNSAFGCREMKGCDLSRQTFRTRKEWYTAENFSAPHEWLIVAFADWKYRRCDKVRHLKITFLGPLPPSALFWQF